MIGARSPIRDVQDDLKLRFTNIFLNVTKQLQQVKLWNKKEVETETVKTEWNILFEDTLKDLSVIYGYFVEYDPLEGEVKYFIKGKNTTKANDRFSPPYIPYFEVNDGSLPQKILNALDNAETKFTSQLNAPKVFQHLPIQPKSNKAFDSYVFEPNKCLNCKVPCEIRSTNDYYVVLFDEIAFFQFAFFYLQGKDILNFYSDYDYVEIFFKYLLKFALGVELKQESEKLFKHLELDDHDKLKWNNTNIEDENKVRRRIEEKVDEKVTDPKWRDVTIEILKKIVDKLIEQVKTYPIYDKSSTDSLSIIRHISRFDIEASLEIKNASGIPILHDVFVFPVYTQKNEKVLTTECIQGEKLDIYSPILIVLYIKTLYEINKSVINENPSFDESETSIDGFHLTKEIIKVFAEQLIQEDYLKKIVKKELVLPSTRAAISQVMARNTSHNIGAHVMNKLIGDLSKVKFKGNYKGGLELYKNETDNNKILLDQISIFNNYVKCRMDYLADISFGTPLMQTNKYAYGELFTELDKVRLLLEHISGLDNWPFEIKFKKNGEPLNNSNDLLVAIPNDILGTQAFYNILENIIRNSAKHSNKSTLKPKEDVVFTVNFIDEVNGVKDVCADNNCDRTLCPKAHKKEIENTLNEFIAVEVYDNIPVEGPANSLSADDIQEYKRMMGDVEPQFDTFIDYLVFNQNKKLNEDILHENSKLRSYSLGLVEMDASAAYLRKRPVEYINHRSYDIQYDESWSRDTEKNKENNQDSIALRGTNCRHFLKAFKKTEEGNTYLGYRFFLHRPAVVLVVTEILEDKEDDSAEKKKDNKDKKDKLRKEGIWVINEEEFEKELKAGKVYPHEFVIIDSTLNFDKVKSEIAERSPGGREIKRTESIDFLEYYKTSLPLRVLKVTQNELTDELSGGVEKYITVTINNERKDIRKTILDAWEEFCWEKWETKLKKKYNYEEYSFNHLPQKSSSDFARITNHLNAKKDKPIEVTWEEYKRQSFYIEPSSTKAQNTWPKYDGNFDTYFDKLQFSIALKAKHAEAILTKIIVIDERVQQGCKEKPFNILQHDVYDRMGVLIPKEETNLAHSTIDKGAIEEFINKNVHNCEIILLHYSILERMFSHEQNRILEINSFLVNLSRSINVIVTSGRGIPDKLPPEIRFMNLSSVIMAFNDVRGKYLINYLLNSSRKTNRI